MPYEPKSVFATLPHTERGMPLVINGDPKGQNFLYCNGNSVIIRNIDNPGISDVYTQHSVQATVAQYSPSGFYIASGDTSGKIRIWDTTQKEHILKYEYQPISGTIKDIAWDADSKRIAVCGQGREKFGHVFLWDSGSSVGEIIGHSKFINAIAYRHVRPYRVVTAGEDKNVGWYEGPPFRYKTMISGHTRFVNIVRFSPDGSMFCTGGADGLAMLCDGKTAEKKGSLGGDKAHSGGIYSLSWSPDSRQVLTASGDKTCKLWDVETQAVVSEFKMGSQVDDQQVSCLWQGSHLLSVSLSGFINYLDVNNPDKPLRVIKGQNKNLTALETSVDGSTVYCGSFDGRLSHWGVDSGAVDLVSGQGHTNSVQTLQATPDKLYSLGLDKSFKTVQTATNEFDVQSLNLPDRDPSGFAVGPDGLAVIATNLDVILARDGTKVSSMSVPYQPVSVSHHPSLPEVAIGGKDSKVYVYTINNDSLTEKTSFSVREEVTVVQYSPDGGSIAVTSGKSIIIFDSANYQEKKTLIFHSARVMSLDWTKDSSKIVSGSIDTNVIIWDVEKGERIQMIKGAHPLSIVSGVKWTSDTQFASCGHDCCIRIWEMV